MTPEEILQGLYDETLVGNAPRVLELTDEALGMGMEPQSLLFDALIRATSIHYLVIRVIVSVVAGLLMFLLNAILNFRRL